MLGILLGVCPASVAVMFVHPCVSVRLGAAVIWFLQPHPITCHLKAILFPMFSANSLRNLKWYRLSSSAAPFVNKVLLKLDLYYYY